MGPTGAAHQDFPTIIEEFESSVKSRVPSFDVCTWTEPTKVVMKLFIRNDFERCLAAEFRFGFVPPDSGDLEMLEKVLKRLCPCYFCPSEDSLLSGFQTKAASDVKQVIRSTDTSYDNGTTLNFDPSSIANGEENWKGAINFVQPQPVYAFPVDLKKSPKRNQKTLLKPPLYWKKTMKNLSSEGPPVFEDSKRKNGCYTQRKRERNKRVSKGIPLKHSETVANISSVSSPSTVEVRWLRSQSLQNVVSTFESRDTERKSKTHRNDKFSAGIKGPLSGGKFYSSSMCELYPDISHGVVLFTAAYFSKKKMCFVNIERLENLSKKGREGNSYYTVMKFAVLPSERYVKCTKILPNCSNPEVRQDFSFSVKDLTGKVLRLSVFDASLQKQHEAIGHALLALDDLASDQLKKYRIKLYRRTQPHICPGNLCLALKYTPKEDKFTIIVDKGRNLSLQRDKNVKLNTYVKVCLFGYGEKVKTKKSLIIMDSRDPNYNSTFTFQVRKDQIDHLSVTITVRLKGFVNDLTIGRLNFGPFFFFDDKKLTLWGKVFIKGESVSHWFRMYL